MRRPGRGLSSPPRASRQAIRARVAPCSRSRWLGTLETVRFTVRGPYRRSAVRSPYPLRVLVGRLRTATAGRTLLVAVNLYGVAAGPAAATMPSFTACCSPGQGNGGRFKRRGYGVGAFPDRRTVRTSDRCGQSACTGTRLIVVARNNDSSQVAFAPRCGLRGIGHQFADPVPNDRDCEVCAARERARFEKSAGT